MSILLPRLRLALALGSAFLGLTLVACGLTPRPPEPPPAPFPPAPIVEPAPAPQPHPAPIGRLLTEAEVMGIPLGAPEAAVVQAFGKPADVLPTNSAGVRVLMYPARLGEDTTRTAEFWLVNGKVTNRLVY